MVERVKSVNKEDKIVAVEKEHLFYDILSRSRDTDMYDLVPDNNGEIEIYGIKHIKKLAKSARI